MQAQSEQGLSAAHPTGSLRRFAVSAASRISTGLASPRLSVLFYHRILDQPDPLRPHEPDAARFAAIAGWLATYFTPLSLSEALRRLDQGTLPAGAICLTFDDGYADNLRIAEPICRERGIPFTVFVASGYLDGGIMWNDLVIESVRRAGPGIFDLTDLGYGRYHLPDDRSRLDLIAHLIRDLRYLPSDHRDALASELAARVDSVIPSPMLSSAQLRQLAVAGVEIGGHTLSHPILARLEDASAWREIADNKADIESVIGRPIRYFAYPNGAPDRDFTARDAQMVSDIGYAAALSTATGVAASTTNRYCLPRFTPWDRTEHRFVLRLMMNMRHCR